MTELSAEKLYEDANELFSNDQLEQALNVFEKTYLFMQKNNII
jgi:hypothetical protein